MKTEKDQRWVPNGSIDLEPCGPGVARKILAYTDGLMCVENHFAAGGIGALRSHPHTQITYVVSRRFRFTIGGEVRGGRPRRHHAQDGRRCAWVRVPGGGHPAGYLCPHAGGLRLLSRRPAPLEKRKSKKKLPRCDGTAPCWAGGGSRSNAGSFFRYIDFVTGWPGLR